MIVETIVKSLQQVGVDEAQSRQVVNAMQDVSEIKISPAIGEMKMFIHQEMNSLTWKLITFNIALIGAVGGTVAAILKFLH